MRNKNFTKQLKAYLSQNLKWKAFALVCALSLWVFAAWQEDSPIESTFAQPLEIRGIEHLSQNNIVMLNEQALSNTVIVVQAHHLQSVRIASNEVIPYIDLSKLDIPGYFDSPVSVSVPIYAQVISPIVQGGYVLVPATTNVNVILDMLETRQHTPQVVITQNPPEGFSHGTIDISPATLSVTGPKSLLNNIYRAVINVDLEGIQEQTNFVSNVVMLAGDETDITNNFVLIPNTVTVDVPINALTNIPITGPEIIGINGIPPGFIYNGFTLSANSVQIMGDASAVAAIGQISLGSVDITGFTGPQTITVDIRGLVSGVMVYSNPEIAIHVDIVPIVPEPEPDPDPDPVFNINLPSSQIDIIGMAPGVFVQDYIPLTIAGENINISAITGTLYVEGLEPGVHNVEVAITLPQGELVAPAVAIVTVEVEGYIYEINE